MVNNLDNDIYHKCDYVICFEVTKSYLILFFGATNLLFLNTLLYYTGSKLLETSRY